MTFAVFLPASALTTGLKGLKILGRCFKVLMWSKNIDLSNEYKLIQRAFTSTAFTIKNGRVVSKKGVLKDYEKGSTIWSDVHLSDPLLIDEAFRNQFRSYWTVEYENYLVSKEYLHLSNPIKVEAQI